MSDQQPGSVANALGTVWFIVLSVWCFTGGYMVSWLAGVAAGLVGWFIARAVLQRKERGK